MRYPSIRDWHRRVGRKVITTVATVALSVGTVTSATPATAADNTDPQPAAPAAAPNASEQPEPGQPNGCKFLDGGVLSKSLCWLDLSSIARQKNMTENELIAAARVDGGIPVHVDLPNAYSMDFNLHIYDKNGQIKALQAPVWQYSVFGNTFSGQKYYAYPEGSQKFADIFNKPLNSPALPGGSRAAIWTDPSYVEITNTSAHGLNAEGQTIPLNYSFIMADAESTNKLDASHSEEIIFDSDQPIRKIAEYAPTIPEGDLTSDGRQKKFVLPCGIGTDNGDGGTLQLPWGTNHIDCVGHVDGVDGATYEGMIIGATENPQHVKVSLKSTSGQGLAIGVLMTTATSSVAVERDGDLIDAQTHFSMDIYKDYAQNKRQMAKPVETTDAELYKVTSGPLLLSDDQAQSVTFRSFPNRNIGNIDAGDKPWDRTRYRPVWTCTRTFRDKTVDVTTEEMTIETATNSDGIAGSQLTVPLYSQSRDDFAMAVDCDVVWKRNYFLNGALKITKNVTGNSANDPALKDKTFAVDYSCAFADDKRQQDFGAAFPEIAPNGGPITGTVELKAGESKVAAPHDQSGTDPETGKPVTYTVSKIPGGMACKLSEKDPAPGNSFSFTKTLTGGSPEATSDSELTVTLPDAPEKTTDTNTADENAGDGKAPIKDDPDSIELEKPTVTNVTVRNNYDITTGTLVTKKTLQGPAAQFFTDHTFTFTTVCDNDPTVTNGDSGSRTVEIALNGNLSASTTSDKVYPVGRNCHITENTQLSAEEAAKYTMTTKAVVDGTETQGVTSNFTINVPADNSDASATVEYVNTVDFQRAPLTIKRVVTGEAAGELDGETTVNYTCTVPNSTQAPDTGSVTLKPDESTTIDNLPVGANCVVTEQAPQVPANTEFSSNATDGKQVTTTIALGTSNTATVEDVLAYKLAHLVVEKVVDNKSNLTLPDDYTVDFNCGSRTIGSTVVPISGSFTIRPGETVTARLGDGVDGKDAVSDADGVLIPVGTNCSVTEKNPNLATGLKWNQNVGSDATNSNVVIAADGAAAQLTNTFDNLGEGIHLQLSVNDPQNVAPDKLKAKVHCEDPKNPEKVLGDDDVEFTLRDNKTWSYDVTKYDAPAGYHCTVSYENPDPVRTIDGHDYEINQNITVEDADNDYAFDVPDTGIQVNLNATFGYKLDGTLTVAKNVTFPGDIDTESALKDKATAAEYTFNATCQTPDGASKTYSNLVATVGKPATVTGVARGSKCVVSEVPPAAIDGLILTAASETSDYVTAGPDSPTTVTMTNAYSRATGAVTVNVSSVAPGPVAATQLGNRVNDVSLVCTNADGQTQTWTKKVTIAEDTLNGAVTFENIPAGAKCAVSQTDITPITFDYKGNPARLNATSQWAPGDKLTPTQSADPKANTSAGFTINPNTATQVAVTNTYSYVTRQLQVEKTIAGSPADLAALGENNRSFVFDYTCDGPDTAVASGPGDSPDTVTVTIPNDATVGASTDNAPVVPLGSQCTIKETGIVVPAALSVSSSPIAPVVVTQGDGPQKVSVTNTYSRNSVSMRLGAIRSGDGASTPPVAALGDARFTVACFADEKHTVAVGQPQDVSVAVGQDLRITSKKLPEVSADKKIVPLAPIDVPADSYCSVTLTNPGSKDDTYLSKDPATAFVYNTSTNGLAGKDVTVDHGAITTETGAPVVHPDDSASSTVFVTTPVAAGSVADVVAWTDYVIARNTITVTKKVVNRATGGDDLDYAFHFRCTGAADKAGAATVKAGGSFTISDVAVDSSCVLREDVAAPTGAVAWSADPSVGDLAPVATDADGAIIDGPLTNGVTFRVSPGANATINATNSDVAIPVITPVGPGDTTVTVTPGPGQTFTPGDKITITVGGKKITVTVTDEDVKNGKVTIPVDKPFTGGETIDVTNEHNGTIVPGQPVTVPVAKSTLRVTKKVVNRAPGGDDIDYTFAYKCGLDKDALAAATPTPTMVKANASFDLPDVQAGSTCVVWEKVTSPTGQVMWNTDTATSTLKDLTPVATDADGAIIDGPLTNGVTFTVAYPVAGQKPSVDDAALTATNSDVAIPVITPVGPGDTTVTVTPGPGQTFTPGDKITITVGGKKITVTVTDEDVKNGKVTIPVDKPFTGGETIDVTNEHNGTIVPGQPVTVRVAFDPKASTLVVTKPNIQLGDDTTIVFTPIGSNGKVFTDPALPATITVTVPGVEGPVTLNRQDNGTYTATVVPTSPVRAGKVTVNPITEGPLAGAENTPPADLTVRPVAPPVVAQPRVDDTTVSITPAKDTTFEGNDTVTITITTADGDTLIRTHVVTEKEAATGRFVYDLGFPLVGGEKIHVSNENAFGKTADGNTVEVVRVPKWDAGKTTLVVTNSDGNVISTTKVGQPVTVTVTPRDQYGNVYTGTDLPDTIEVSVPGVDRPVTLTRQPDGTYTGTTTPTTATDPSVDTRVTVTSGFPQKINDAPLKVYDTPLPVSPTPTVTGIEKGGHNAVISGEVPATDGSTVTITYTDANGTPKTAETTVKNGKFVVDLPDNDIPAGTPITAVVTEPGKAPSKPGTGPMVVIPAKPVAHDTTAGDTSVTITAAPGEKFVPGDKVTITVGKTTVTHIVTEDDVKNGKLVVDWPHPLAGGDTITPTNQRPGTDVIPGVDGHVAIENPKITQPKIGDHTITVTPVDGRYVDGDTITVTVDGKPYTHTITAKQAHDGKVVIPLDAPLPGDNVITAVINRGSVTSTTDKVVVAPAPQAPESSSSDSSSAAWVLPFLLIPFVTIPFIGSSQPAPQPAAPVAEPPRPATQPVMLAQTGVDDSLGLVLLLGMVLVAAGAIITRRRRSTT